MRSRSCWKIGRVGSGDYSQAFLVGDSKDFDVPVAGRLYLGLNQSESDAANATGSFHVKVEILNEGLADARTAVCVADKTGDPMLLLLALDALIEFEGTDELATQARAVTDHIYASLPNEVLRRCFTESEVMRRIRAPH